MEKECIVDHIKGNYAYIKLKKQESCNGCKACAFSKTDNSIVAAKMEVKCNQGDSVLVRLCNEEIRLGSILIYLIPILFLIIGFIVAIPLKNDVLQIISSISFCALSFIIVYFIDKGYRNYMPVIIKNLKENKND